MNGTPSTFDLLVKFGLRADRDASLNVCAETTRPKPSTLVLLR